MLRYSEELIFDEIVAQQSEYLLRIAYLYVKDWQSAEDIVQDVFLTY